MENGKNISGPFSRSTIIFVGSPGKKKSSSSKLKMCKNYFSEYCNNSTIHGFKYVGEQDRSLIEKASWVVFLMASLYFCGDLIQKTKCKWESSPILVGFKQNPIPVWKVPFPAITVCPMMKVRQTIFNQTELMDKYESENNTLTADELNHLHDLSLICYERFVKEGGSEYFTEETLEFFQKVGPDFSTITRHLCRFRNKDINCGDEFTPTLTDEGICYTLNMLDRRDLFTDVVAFNGNFMSHNKTTDQWDFVRGYSSNSTLNSFPYRDIFILKKDNIYFGFTAILGVRREDVDYSCSGIEQGFKLFFHHPAEVLIGGESYVLTPLNYDNLVIVKPEMMTTSEELRSYAPDVRQCYYPHEKELAFFKIYTQKNCEMECLSNYTKSICGCVPFYMPRINDTKMCGPRKIPCMKFVREVNMGLTEAFNFDEEYIDNLMADDFLRRKNYFLEFEEKSENFNRVFDIKSCKCRPSCTAVRYDIQKDTQTIDWQRFTKSFGFDENATNDETFVSFTVLYGSNKIIASERKALFGIIELIGNCGGILGLFTGFSFLSGFEILYYLSLRVWCNLKHSGRIDRINCTE